MRRRDRKLLRQPWRELSGRKGPNGVEKFCNACGEWLLLDDENFTFLSSRGHYHCHCKLCRAGLMRASRQRTTAA